jgi:two-component system, chemotaxis family, chemotaxis protein CheY
MESTILIVDDSRTARALFRACISGLGDYQVYEASGWRDALEQAKEHKPILCVMDYNMPEKVGTQIATEIIDAGIDTKFVLMTANTQQSVVDEAMALGFLEVVEKPLSANALAALLERVSC